MLFFWLGSLDFFYFNSIFVFFYLFQLLFISIVLVYIHHFPNHLFKKLVWIHFNIHHIFVLLFKLYFVFCVWKKFTSFHSLSLFKKKMKIILNKFLKSKLNFVFTGDKKQNVEGHCWTSWNWCKQQCSIYVAQTLHETLAAIWVSFWSRRCWSTADY